MNSLSLACLGNTLSLLQLWMKILLGRVFLAVSFSFILLKNISFHYLMTFKFSAKIISWLSYGDSWFPIPFILSVAVHIFSCLQFLSQDFISLSSFWIPYNVNFVCLTLSQRSLKLSSLLFILFSLFLSSDLNHSVFKLTYLSSSFFYWYLPVNFSSQLLYSPFVSLFFTLSVKNFL